MQGRHPPICGSILCLCLAISVFAHPVSAAAPERPLIFLPGILGSKLIDENDKIVWGNRKSYFNFRNLALPADDSDIKIKPDGVIDSITIVWPFKVKQYGGLRSTLSDLGYVEEQNLFIFAYDWRRSNYKNAALLEELIKNTPALQSGEFDLIAHSMGGIVSLILIHELEAGKRVKNFITLGTPYFGSLNAFEIFLSGFSGASNFMSEIGTSEDNIRSVMFSFESGYELLPSYSLCCVQGVPNSQHGTPIELYQATFWLDEWLPDGFSTDENKSFISDSLERGKQLRELIRKPIPATVEHYMFAGGKFDTRAQVYFDEQGTITHFRRMSGDGTVWLQSATRFDQRKARVSFRKHARIFDDKGLKVELGWILTPDGPLTNFAATVEEVKFESKAGISFDVDFVYFEASPVLVALGQPVKARMELTGAEITATNETFQFNVCIDLPTDTGDETCSAMQEVAETDESRNFEVTFDIPVEGDFTFNLAELPGVEDYFSVIDPE